MAVPVVGIANVEQRLPAAYFLANLISVWIILASGQAAFWRLVRHRQRERIAG